MKKLVAVITLCIITQGVMFAQTDGEKRAAFQFGFVTPLSTNGFYASQYTNRVSINVLLGISRNETGFALGGIANVVTNNADSLLPTFRIAPHFEIFGGQASIICKLRTCPMQRCFRPIPCGKSMAYPNFSRCISVIKWVFNMSFEFACDIKKICIPK